MPDWDAEQLNFDREGFSGVARLFPVPNLVVFPHVVQPLHVFEERYREMLEDAMADDQLIAMALLAPGWEVEYASRPKLVPWACLGKVISHTRLEDGRYNLLLAGLGRVKIVEELDPVRSFRQAKVEWVEDMLPTPGDATDQLATQLLHQFKQHFSSMPAGDTLKQLLDDGLSLAMLTDLIAYALPLDGDVKQKLLTEPCVRTRARTLLDILSASSAEEPPAARGHVFPPPFSEN